MEFWGVEVKSGQNFEVELEDDGSRILHLSQVVIDMVVPLGNSLEYVLFATIVVALGEGTGDNKKEKGKETICLYLKFKNQKFVVGTLSQEKCPQIALDLVLHDKFELFHTWKNGSVYVTGYYVDTSQGSDTESEGELPEPTMNLVKSEPAASDPTTTKQAGPSKKRPAESSKKTPTPEKKAKLKAGGHTATPHPSKKAGKTSAAAAQVKQTPRSGGSFPCKSCGRSFGSENALQSHSKAKHGTQA
ncbi:hypothetical protein GOBAR_AA31511 [Gossypium barbadense]|uniref:C2H2-type domain-containing protein n=1 Tax=Gossypium barbadense TaxID=3634 RepID=A0A2P5WDM6_GOSBA|nr:hypothetical protein GOBAR_AA31511 [Gossypium barbadense]